MHSVTILTLTASHRQCVQFTRFERFTAPIEVRSQIRSGLSVMRTVSTPSNEIFQIRRLKSLRQFSFASEINSVCVKKLRLDEIINIMQFLYCGSTDTVETSLVQTLNSCTEFKSSLNQRCGCSQVHCRMSFCVCALRYCV